ncbi:DNA-binding response regulator [Dokdonia pacifica]|uniref:Two component transcriptional regulator, LytTR family n=1 Tax=Dokdonia pacifica TaxID=1627892 RepID=A0A238WLL2_9FLAO|nr:LytTR family DNA-binding domain-containing protein [Dokdonia pacifica]GGG22301.1 DNA-binding response regulator [Dokdonia pacifica]SNR47466.1 two component transcriptional regulator, LytTR family [Dokdonia pacifica]
MYQESEHIHILIADDESLARKRVRKFITESTIDCTIIEASSGKEALHVIETYKIDLVFLDIKMTDMSGFEVLQQLPKDKIPIIIFVTAFDAFAVKAFEVQAIDFLLKPYKKDRFYEAFDRGLKQLQLSQQHIFQNKISKLVASIPHLEGYPIIENTSYIETLVLKSKKKYYFLKVSDIKYITSSGYYVEIFTETNERHVHRISMTDLLSKLDPAHYFRVNRSVIIHKKHIQEVISEGAGDYSIVMKDKTSYALSKKYKSDFLNHMGIK